MGETVAVLPGWFVYVAALISVVGIITYVRDTLAGKTFPHRVTWFLWGFIPLVTFVIQVHLEVGIQSVLTLTFAITPLAVLTASFISKRGSWSITTFDWICGATSLVGLGFYLVTRHGVAAIVLLLIADFFAAIPTLRKSFTSPESETWTAFFAGLVSSVLTLGTITHWSFATYAFPAYIATQNAVEVAFIRYRIGPRFFSTDRIEDPVSS